MNPKKLIFTLLLSSFPALAAEMPDHILKELQKEAAQKYTMKDVTKRLEFGGSGKASPAVLKEFENILTLASGPIDATNAEKLADLCAAEIVREYKYRVAKIPTVRRDLGLAMAIAPLEMGPANTWIDEINRDFDHIVEAIRRNEKEFDVLDCSECDFGEYLPLALPELKDGENALESARKLLRITFVTSIQKAARHSAAFVRDYGGN
jgi:hypothetical protein